MADELADMFDIPEEPPGKQRTITEEFLSIVEDFSEYIEKFMFEIVTFLAVVDSSMGLIKDVLGLFGFEGWRLAFFPTFSFIVTTSVFLFGTKKRKTKREADAGGLGQALEMFEDVMDVMDDVVSVVEELEEDDNKGEEGGEGDIEGECIGGVDQSEGEPSGEAPVDENKAKIRQVLGVVMLVGGIVAKLRKREKDAQQNETEDSRQQEADASVNSEKTHEASNTRVVGSQGRTIGTRGDVGLPALDTCSVTANSTTNNTASVCVNFHGTSREISKVDTVAKRDVTTHEVWRSSSSSARNVAHVKVISTDKTPQEALGVGIAVGQASVVEPPLTKLGPSGMAGNMVQGTTAMAGSLSNATGKAAAQGAQKSGGLIPLVVRMVRIVVRLANRGKGKKTKSEDDEESQASKETNEKEDLREVKSNIRGSLISLNYDCESIYYDCESHITSTDVPTGVPPPRTVSSKSIVSAGTQTDGESNWSICSPWQSQARLHELENRVFELEAAERDKTRSSQVNMGDITHRTNREGEELQKQTRKNISAARKSKRYTESQGVDFKSIISENRNENALNKVEFQSPIIDHQWQFPSTSGLSINEFPRSRGVQHLDRSGRFSVDSPVIVHHENSKAPYGAERTNFCIQREDYSGRAGLPRFSEYQATAKPNASSTEDLVPGPSCNEISGLSLSSVRFVDEIARKEIGARDISYRQGRENTSNTKHRDSRMSQGKGKNPRLAPLHDPPESRRLHGNQFVANNHKWNKDKWTSDICLTGQKHSSRNKYSSRKDQTSRERHSSEWNLRRETGAFSRQPTHSLRITRSPSTFHRSQSSCLGDDESF